MIDEVWKTAVASLGSVAYLFLITRLIGHRQISQLDVFDYITGITIGNMAGTLAVELEKPLRPIVAMAVFGFVTLFQLFVLKKWNRSRKYINGTPTILFNNGRLYRENMNKVNLELSEFLMLCREAGYFDLGGVQTAIFEHDGKMTFLPVAARRPATPADLNLAPRKESIFTEVIMDGRILEGNLRRMNKDRLWLEDALRAQGYRSAGEVFLGLCDEQFQLSFYQMDNG